MKTYLVTLILSFIEIVAPRKRVAAFTIFNDGSSVEDMTARLNAIKSEAGAIQNLAKTQNRELTSDEEAGLLVLLDEFELLKTGRDTKLRIESASFDLGGGGGRRAAGVKPNASINNNSFDLGDDHGEHGINNRASGSGARVRSNLPEGQWGFKSLGEFGQAVRLAHPGLGTQIDNRLLPIINNDDTHDGIRNNAGDAALERIGEEGGFLIPPDFRDGIKGQVEGTEFLLPMTMPIPIQGNQFVANLDETTPWQTAGGILAFWEGEGNQLQGSRPKLTPTTVRANKLTALVIVTDELLEDATALGAYIGRKAPEKIGFKESMAIFNGSGAGQPSGILKANSTLVVAKEAGQAADTIVAANINKMYASMYAPYIRNGVWLCNQDVLPQLEALTTDGSTGTPVYTGPTAAGGLIAPFGMLKGRPIIFSEVCETVGDLGDINFIDFAQYLAIVKSNGVVADASIHLYFDYGETTFRFTKRVGGQSWWPKAITKRAGGSVAPAVTLAARA